MKTIAVVTTSRADYGIYRPLLKALHQEKKNFNLQIIASGMHLLKEHGNTIQEIEEDGFNIVARLDFLRATDNRKGMLNSMARGLTRFTEAFSELNPDIVVILGDRFEMHSAAVAASLMNIIVVHLHGGELTLGAMDDALRHSMTKLSHLHFVSTECYQKRVIQLGEEPWRVHLSGALSLDNFENFIPASETEIEKRLNMDLKKPPILVTFHPVTLDVQDEHLNSLLKILETIKDPIIFTAPNADPQYKNIFEKIHQFIRTRENATLQLSLGSRLYFSLMSKAIAMIGNSSSGLIEAASFGLPVVNIGNRQEGRVRGQNVIDVEGNLASIQTGLDKALSLEFKSSVKNMNNPYYHHGASKNIMKILKNLPAKEVILKKKFYDAD